MASDKAVQSTRRRRFIVGDIWRGDAMLTVDLKVPTDSRSVYPTCQRPSRFGRWNEPGGE